MTPLEQLDHLGVGRLYGGKRLTAASLCKALSLPPGAFAPSNISQDRALALAWAVELWDGRVPVGVQAHTRARELAVRIGIEVARLRGCEVPAMVERGRLIFAEAK